MSQQTGKTVVAWGPSTVETGEEKEEVDLACSFVGVKNQNTFILIFYLFFPFTSFVAGIVIPQSFSSFCIIYQHFSLLAVIIFYQ